MTSGSHIFANFVLLTLFLTLSTKDPLVVSWNTVIFMVMFGILCGCIDLIKEMMSSEKQIIYPCECEYNRFCNCHQVNYLRHN